MRKLKVLVFPCGSEVALEIHRSMKDSIHFELLGANSVDDHGKYVYQNYYGGLPLITDDHFIDEFEKLVNKLEIDLIYPAMDSVIVVLKQYEERLRRAVISSPLDTTIICQSKSLTYQKLSSIIRVPQIFSKDDLTIRYPVFVKPDKGYGSRGAKVINNQDELKIHLALNKEMIICEYLPGDEYTIDCFTDRHGELLFSGARQRSRVSNGISVNTATNTALSNELYPIAEKINKVIKFRGAWFFQLKRNALGEVVLLEIAARLGGSSSVHRIQGANFALMSAFDLINQDVDVIINDFRVELDRALVNKYKIDIDYDEVFIDFDDTIIINEQVNTEAIAFLYQSFNEGKKIILITKHKYDLKETLNRFRIPAILFDEIVHIDSASEKKLHILGKSAIFIDDSFMERQKIHSEALIPVFGVDSISALIK